MTRSCFLPGTFTQFAWDSTSLGYLKTCPRLYQYIMIDGWTSSVESAHLRFGLEYHKALEDYDRYRAGGLTSIDATRQVLRELLFRTADFDPDPDTKAGKYKNTKSLIQMVINYIDDHQNDACKTFIKADGNPAVELSFSFELDWGPLGEAPYLLCGHLDRVVNLAGDLYVMDRKSTTSTAGSYFFNQFSPNNQMTLYSLAAKVILSSPVRGVIIDAAQILLTAPYSAFTRGVVYHTPAQLDEWLHDLRYWLNLAESYSNAGYWPQNDTACDKFGGCRFREVCSKSPEVREVYLKSSFTQLPEEDRWNPLKPR